MLTRLERKPDPVLVLTVGLDMFLDCRSFSDPLTVSLCSKRKALYGSLPQNKADVRPRLSSRSEMAATLYQNLSLTEPRLIPQLENVIMIFVKEIKQQNSEMENLALAIKRYPSVRP